MRSVKRRGAGAKKPEFPLRVTEIDGACAAGFWSPGPYVIPGLCATGCTRETIVKQILTNLDERESHLLIDWMTLRIPLSDGLGSVLLSRIRECVNTITCVDSNGELIWTKAALDIDALRSDTVGLCWMVQSDGVAQYLSIGASPASLEHGVNVFGSCDVQHCAGVIILHAQKALKAILPGIKFWQCRRIDITGNYVLPDAGSVKQALRQLSISDGGRRRATNKAKGGDSVYWNPTSDLVKGKAYHKGPHLVLLRRKGRIECSDEMIEMANRLLRLEHTLGARWFRRLGDCGKKWFDLTSSYLESLYMEFFEKVIGGVEVVDMDRDELVERIKSANGISEGRALAAFTTYRNIRQDGFEIVKSYMASRTWYLHLKYLRGAGISDSDLQMGNVVQFKPVRIILAKPVSSWDEIRLAA
jgi:II/X family phage/plasmid replication protein